jgi:hypothetical protein
LHFNLTAHPRMVKILVASERATTQPLRHRMDSYHARSVSLGAHICPLSPVLSIKNCCCETNTYPPRIAFSEHTCPPDSACLMLSDLPWPRSANDSAVKPSTRSPAWPSRIPFSPGMGNWWHTSSTALAVAAILADPGYRPEWSGW